MEEQIFGLALIIMLIIIGLFRFVVAFLPIRKSLHAKSWPKVRGTITKSDLIKCTGYYSMSKADVSFEYVVKGKNYSSNIVNFGDCLFNRWIYIADDVLRTYSVGNIHTVYYNPKKPEVAVLETRTRKNVWFSLILGIALLTIGIVLIVCFILYLQ